MSKLPLLPPKDIAKVLEKKGYSFQRQSGSHIIYKKEGKPVVVIPAHKEVARGTLRSILRQAEMSREKFFELLDEI